MSTDTEIFFSDIEKSYLNRCEDTVQASNLWKTVIEKYPPEKLHEYSRRPSLELARWSGDLAVALLWGAQATLIRPLLKTAIENETNHQTLTLLINISSDSVGALAIAEDKKIPFLVKEKSETFSLNGKKKYITGGAQSDFLLLTEKNDTDKRLSAILFLETKDIPKSSFQPLDMACLSTSRHASLTMTDLLLPARNRLSIAPKAIRKMLKTWGMIEQSLIMEAVTGLTLYLATRFETETGEQVSSYDETEIKLHQLSSEIDQQIKSAVQGEFIQPIQLETEHLSAMLREMKLTEKKVSKELSYRFLDIQFFLGKVESSGPA